VLLAVAQDQVSLSSVPNELRRRYEADYEVRRVGSPQAALELLEELRRGGATKRVASAVGEGSVVVNQVLDVLAKLEAAKQTA
jgi:hypothetical protein